MRISVASGSGISCFYRVGMRDWQGKQSEIRDFNSSARNFMTNAKPELAKMNPLCVYIAACVWFQFMNSRT